MPEAAQNIHDTKDLEHQVGDLLQQMEAGTQRLAAEAAALPTPPAPPTAPAGGAPDPGPAGADLSSAVEKLLSEAAPAQPAAGTAAAPAGPDLALAVEKLLSDAAPTKAEPSPAVQNGKIDSLDAELAGLADELIAGEFEGETATVRADAPRTQRAPVPAAAPVAAPAPAPAASPAPVPAPVAEAPKPAAPAPTPKAQTPKAQTPVVAAPLAAPVPETAPEPAPKPATPKEPADVAPAPAKAVETAATAPAAPAARPGLLSAMAAISGPLQSRPHLRDILGWVALVQAFLALCVWVWVLFVRSDKPVDPPPVTPAQESAGEPTAIRSGYGSHQATAKKARRPVKKPASGETHH